jgi:hypothetical protein
MTSTWVTTSQHCFAGRFGRLRRVVQIAADLGDARFRAAGARSRALEGQFAIEFALKAPRRSPRRRETMRERGSPRVVGWLEVRVEDVGT